MFQLSYVAQREPQFEYMISIALKCDASFFRFNSSCWLSSGNGTNAIWTFVAPMLAIVLVSHDSHGKSILVQTIPQESLLSVCLDQQCVPGPGPSQSVQNTWEAYVGHEREGKTC